MKKNDSQSVFFGKKILIGVTGSIAAYKIPELVRLFVKNGAEVKIILSNDACNFVSPLVLSTLSKNKVISDFVTEDKMEWHNHVELGLWADVFLIAPATANTLSKMATGLCDNILLATFLSCTCPIFCSPAMDRDMYLNRVNSKNLSLLKKRNIYIFNVDEGELASGLHGLGRMKDVNSLFLEMANFFLQSLPLFEKKILITAGPTYEQIDPVRFIGNFSSGKMGCELAKQAANLGASVDLILGPSSESLSHPRITIFNIQTAQQMFKACESKFIDCDIAFFASAVSDFKPSSIKKEKIKTKSIIIETEPNIDIVKTLSSDKTSQFIVGFALETQNEESNAVKKMKNKNMDLIILNSLRDNQSGFGFDTNKITIIDNDLNIKKYPLMKKSEVAKVILDEVLFHKSEIHQSNAL